MSAPLLSISQRTGSTPFTPRVEHAGVKSYTVYNHTLLATAFRTIEADYRHLKSHVQVWDVSCERQVEVRGPDAARLVQLMTPRDLSRATQGRCLYVPLVDETGGMINDPIALKLGEDRFWLSIADSDVLLWAKGLAFGMSLDVDITEPDVFPLAVQGPKADELMARVFGDATRSIRFFRFDHLPFNGHPLLIARSGWSRQGGFEIYVDDATLAPALWDALMVAGRDLAVGPGCPNAIERIEGGLLSYGSDMTREHNPFECGLDQYCQLDRPTEFMSRGALQRIVDEGIARRIMGLRINADGLPPCHVPWPVVMGGQQIGQVSSAAWSPDFDCGVALAMLGRDHWEPGSPVEVDTPNGVRSATVASLPFTNERA